MAFYFVPKLEIYPHILRFYIFTALLKALFEAFDRRARLVFVFISIIAFFTLIYFTLWLGNLSMETRNTQLIIKQGMIIKKEAVFPKKRLVYFCFFATPFQKAFGLVGCKIKGMGIKHLYYPLTKKDAIRLIGDCKANE